MGEYETIVSNDESDCDTISGVTGRFRHSFELYHGHPHRIVPRQANFVLVIEFHDGSNGSYKELWEFANVPSMLKFVGEYGPVARFPMASRTPETISELSARYADRSMHFVKLVEELPRQATLHDEAGLTVVGAVAKGSSGRV